MVDAYLLTDAVSYFKKGKIYATKGTKVKVLSINNNVAIVEVKKGEGFTIFVNQLIDKK